MLTHGLEQFVGFADCFLLSGSGTGWCGGILSRRAGGALFGQHATHIFQESVQTITFAFHGTASIFALEEFQQRLETFNHTGLLLRCVPDFTGLNQRDHTFNLFLNATFSSLADRPP